MVLAPFAFLFLNSVKPAAEFATRPPTLLPSHLTLEHWRAAFDPNGDTCALLWNSLVVTGCATLLTVVTGTLAAYALDRLRLPFRLTRRSGFVFLFVRFYPKITVALPYFILARQAAAPGHPHGADPGARPLGLPFVVWLLLGFLEELPKELEESAIIDGGSVWQRFRRVVLPLAAPVVATAAVLTAILSWNEFLLASTVAPNLAKTLPVRISAFVTDKGIALGPDVGHGHADRAAGDGVRPRDAALARPRPDHGGGQGVGMTRKHLFAEMTWPEVNEAVRQRRVILLPVGAIEQHGPHLPVDVDNRITVSICEEAARRAPDILAAMPPIHYGYNAHNMDFPGTISIR